MGVTERALYAEKALSGPLWRATFPQGKALLLLY